MRSRNLFVNLRRAVPQAGIEDFVSEGLCWVLTTHAPVQQRFLERVLAGGSLGESWSWRTQVNMASFDGRSRPDVVGDGEHHLVLVECKVDAPTLPQQLAEHRRHARETAGERRVLVVLIARAPTSNCGADVMLTWRDVQTFTRGFVDQDPDGMAAQFSEFLGVEGLGRVPGACPTFWKASILEARARDVSKGMGRGYHDLGHKFAAAVLPHALEDLAAEGDDQPLRHALEIALESPDPVRPVWRVIRSFFPSYLFRDDDRFGSLRLNDRQGHAFARGFIEYVEVDGLPT